MNGLDVKYFYLGLPPASILKKIGEIDPDGPTSIIDFAERLQLGRHKSELEEQRAEFIAKKRSPVTLWQGLKNIFNAINYFDRRPVPNPVPIVSPKEALDDVWLNVGNDIRRSIELYLQTNPRTARSIVLTSAEVAALRPVPVRTILKAQKVSP